VIRVLVVDDSAFVRRTVGQMLSGALDLQVVGEAQDGEEAVEKVRELRPDVVTLDIKMPRMSGLEALRRIMTLYPTPVLLLSSFTGENAQATLRALELGALDFVDKSKAKGPLNLPTLGEELRAKLRAVAAVPRHRLTRRAPLPGAAGQPPSVPHAARGAEVVVIAASTGGPPALTQIIPRLPASLSSPVLLVQHMPVGFTHSLAQRLDGRSALRVREARDDEPVAPGTVLVAPAGSHMKVRRREAEVRVVLDDEPRDTVHRPSADVLMTSVARAFGARCLGVVLTGMGSDGVAGLRAIREAGGRTLAESEESCVIYGMPKAAVEAGVVDRVVPLSGVADAIIEAV
jgi:two-component system chemotaxis response regulator CheB